MYLAFDKGINILFPFDLSPSPPCADGTYTIRNAQPVACNRIDGPSPRTASFDASCLSPQSLGRAGSSFSFFFLYSVRHCVRISSTKP